MNRAELLDLLVKMDRDIVALKESATDKHRKLKYLECYCIELEEHARRGQNQALSVCGNNIHKSILKAFRRWHIKTEYLKLKEVYHKLAELQQDCSYIKSQCKHLDMKNKSLMNENIELRQVSLDGLSLGEAISNIKKEKERLSCDLTERNTIIQRLMEENKELAFQLRHSDTPKANSYGLRRMNY